MRFLWRRERAARVLALALAALSGVSFAACESGDVVMCAGQITSGAPVNGGCSARWTGCDDGRTYAISCRVSGPGLECACEIDGEAVARFGRKNCVEGIGVARRRCDWDIELDDEDEDDGW